MIHNDLNEQFDCQCPSHAVVSATTNACGCLYISFPYGVKDYMLVYVTTRNVLFVVIVHGVADGGYEMRDAGRRRSRLFVCCCSFVVGVVES